MEIRKTGRFRSTLAEVFFTNIHRSALPASLPLWMLPSLQPRRLRASP